MFKARARFNLGNSYLYIDNTRHAMDAFKVCLEIRRCNMPNHVYTAFACHKIGLLLKQMGDLDAACELFKEAVRILLLYETPHLGALVRAQHCLSLVLEQLGSFSRAADLRRSVTERMVTLGEKTVPEEALRELASDHFDNYVLFCHR